jgi:hypothetical protein
MRSLNQNYTQKKLSAHTFMSEHGLNAMTHLRRRQHTNHEKDYSTYITGHHTTQKD